MATLIDIGVILVLLLSAGVSFFRGFIREVLTIVGVVGGLLAALMFGKMVTPLTRDWFGVAEGKEPDKLLDLIPYSIVADATAYVGIFLIVFIILQLFSHFIAASARAVGLGPVDRTLGVIFGLARGIILLGILYLPFNAILPEENKKQWFEGSATAFYIEATSDWLASFLPDADKDQLKNETREKLQALDVLNSGTKKEEPVMREQKSAPEDGYTEKARERLEDLIEKQSPSKDYND
jgi:membrane protein required for colicin V production